MRDTATLDRVGAAAYTIPTDRPEADGTLSWDSTTMVCVTARAGGRTGLGWTYAPAACAALVEDLLVPLLVGETAIAPARCARTMRTAVRNAGRTGLAGYAISAVDVALWDLKARMLEVSLADLLGPVRPEVPVYGSGGFTTYDAGTLVAQAEDWLRWGMRAVKIKIGEAAGADVARDLERVRHLRDVVGSECELYVDANGGYRAKQAIRVGRSLRDLGVTWFEEPVGSEDKEGLGRVRAALDLDVAAGEYAGDLQEFRRLCAVVDCLQIDATRCGGITGWLSAAAVAASYGLEVSGHCAPHLHLAVAAATPGLRHLEWFHDHVRIEGRYLDGAAQARDGVLPVGGLGPGHGYTVKEADLEEHRVR